MRSAGEPPVACKDHKHFTTVYFSDSHLSCCPRTGRGRWFCRVRGTLRRHGYGARGGRRRVLGGGRRLGNGGGKHAGGGSNAVSCQLNCPTKQAEDYLRIFDLWCIQALATQNKELLGSQMTEQEIKLAEKHINILVEAFIEDKLTAEEYIELRMHVIHMDGSDASKNIKESLKQQEVA